MLSLKRNLSFIIAVIILAVFLLASLFYLAITVKENAALNFSKYKKLDNIKEYFKGGAFPPSEKLLDYYLDKNGKFLKYYETFYSDLVSARNEMPDKILEPLKFKEKLLDSQSQIIKKAKASDLSVGEKALYLGFDRYQTEIPLQDDIPDLMVELESVRELFIYMMKAGMISVERVEILKPQDIFIKGEKKPFVRVFPVRLSAESAFENFVKFLKFCADADSGDIFVFSDMHVYQANQEKKTIKSDILVNIIIFI